MALLEKLNEIISKVNDAFASIQSTQTFIGTVTTDDKGTIVERIVNLEDNPSSGGASSWGGIGGDISNQLDLVSELDSKHDIIAASDIARMRAVPMGQKAFAKSTINKAVLEQTLPNYSVKGDFTCIKRFHAGIKAYSSNFIYLLNDGGDSVRIYNHGYSFKFEVKKNGVQVFYYTTASNDYFPNGLAAITVYFQVDYDLEQLIIERDDGSVYIVPAVGIGVVKDVLFTKIEAGVNAYYGKIKDWFLLSGLFSYTGMNKIFSSNSNTDDILPQARIVQSSVGKNEVLTAPTSYRLAGVVTTSFVNGKATFGTFADKPYCTFIGASFSEYIKTSKQFIAKFSMDVRVGSVDFVVSGVTPYIAMFRAIEKDTGQVIEVRNKSGAHQSIATIPVGRWNIIHYAEASNLGYFLRMGFATADLEFDIFDDFTAIPVGIALSVTPNMADYESVYCPFSGQVSVGTWALDSAYY